MMRRIMTCLAAGGILVAMAGFAQAGCECEGFFTEGPPYECSATQKAIIPAMGECFDQETFYTEGMRYSPCDRGQATLVMPIADTGDFHCEGFTDSELEYMRHLRIIEDIVPAAGHESE